MEILSQQVSSFALLQSLAESLTQAEVVLVLAAADELPDLVSTWARDLLGGSSSWSRGSCCCGGGAASTEHPSDGTTSHMTNGRAHCHTSCSGRHLSHQTRLLGSSGGRGHSTGSSSHRSRGRSWSWSRGRSRGRLRGGCCRGRSWGRRGRGSGG